jgi:hypothetical protein
VPESSASVEIKGRPEDRRALSLAFRDARRWTGRLNLLIGCLLFAVVVIFGRDIFMRYWQMPMAYAATLAAFIGLVVFITSFDIAGRSRVRKTTDPRATFTKGYRVTLDDEGVHIDADHFRALHRWPGVLKLQETDKHLFLYTDGAQAIIVPKRCFASPEDAERFAGVVRAHLASA